MMTDNSSSIQVKVARCNPETGTWFQNFVVPCTQPLSVMSILAIIHGIDPTFACRTSTCFKGQCGSCLVKVNGRDVFGCTTIICPGESIVVEPYSKYPVIRDVVVDFSQPLCEEKE